VARTPARLGHGRRTRNALQNFVRLPARMLLGIFRRACADMRPMGRSTSIERLGYAVRNDPLALAVASRVVQLEHEPTDEEVAAFMRRLAADGYKDLLPHQCQEVVEFVIEETRGYNERLDHRHLTKAFEDRRQWEDGHSTSSWQDLVRTSLRKLAIEDAEVPMSKKEDISDQRERVAEAVKLFPNDVDKQMEHTGLKKSTFYKRRQEVAA
jgi:hypothetical protein